VQRSARAGVLAALALMLGAGVRVPALETAEPSAAVAAPDPAETGYSPQGADSCLGCHSDPNVTDLFHTKHARPGDRLGPFGQGGLQCEACHGPGGAHVKAGGGPLAGMIDFGPKALTPPLKQNAVCLGCHEANTAHDWAASPHAAANVACAGCHTLHASKDPMQSAPTQIETCTSCHQAQRTDLLKPSHHPMREGKMACTSCHSPHGSTGPSLLTKSTVTETCTGCHAEYRGPFLWEHQPVAENCTTCHNPHGSAQSSLLKLRPPFLCQSCHEGAGHPSIINTPNGLPGRMPSAYLLAGSCTNCHSQIHGSNSPSGRALMR